MDRNQVTADMCEIVNLLNLYAFAVDTLQWELFDSIFTEDTQLDYPSSQWSDLATFKQDFEVAHARLKTTQHMVTNHMVKVDGDQANALCYARARLVSHGPDGSDDFWEFGGWYDDVLVRTSSGWRIKRRACRGNWLEGGEATKDHPARKSIDPMRNPAAAGEIEFLEAVKG